TVGIEALKRTRECLVTTCTDSLQREQRALVPWLRPVRQLSAMARRGPEATVQETMKAINASCRSKGGHYAGYSCKVVSWDDVSRGTGPSGLSCWGANITDTYLKSRSGTPLFTLRADNWNERLGIIDAQRVALVAPGAPGLSAPGEAPTLRPVTLQRVLKEMGRYGHYAGLASDVDLSDALRDTKCSIRFQTTFLPVEASDTRPAVLEFATEAYNYNTMRDEDPRNLVLLCTSQGIAVQQDGRGAKKLFHHAADPSGRIHRYWLEAEETHHKVGGEQRETDAERAVALARGKATASVIGIPAMGQRFNVLMTIQVPLRQAPKRVTGGLSSVSWNGTGELVVTTVSQYELGDTLNQCKMLCSKSAYQMLSYKFHGRARSRSGHARGRGGKSSAARVSRGSEVDIWPGLTVQSPQRHPAEHVTVTVQLYHVVVGGVPSEEDVTAAIDDLENLYRACVEDGKLADGKFDFLKKPLSLDDLADIPKKVWSQPPEVMDFDVFPV
ncbi:unnamed protein product, partial [Durusdinium trenchii]